MMSRTVVDIDRDALEAARSHLGTATIKDTVNEALRGVARARTEQQLAALDGYPAEPIDEFLEWRRSRDDRMAP